MPNANSYGGVVKDPLDLRDLIYESGLFELPFAIDNRSSVPVVLDQGEEGACTGFGLAAVVNFLLHNHSGLKKPERDPFARQQPGARPRLPNEMAQRNDK